MTMTVDDSNFFKELQAEFLNEAIFLIEQCEESYLNLEKPENRKEELGKIFRLAHSLKGAGASVGYTDLANFAHKVEDCLARLRVNTNLVSTEVISLLLSAGDAIKKRIYSLKENENLVWDIQVLEEQLKKLAVDLENKESTPLIVLEVPVAKEKQPSVDSSEDNSSIASSKIQASSVKVDPEKIDSVLNMIGELVVLKSQLVNESLVNNSSPNMNSLISHMDKSIRDLQDKTLSMRMTPFKNLFMKMQRAVRDLSLKLNKPVEFQTVGEETEIDRTMVELLADPLLHVLRNALDHGIENSNNRREKNKREAGIIKLEAQQTGSRIMIKISDDGGGIPRDKIIKKAVEKGIIPSLEHAKNLTDNEVFQFIFAPGFSTAENVTDVSGRGVGMDIVKTNIEQLKGTIHIHSELNAGTTFTLSLPLTTSITDGMLVKAANQHFILPLNNIIELLDSSPEALVGLHTGEKLVNIRGKVLPLINLDEDLLKQDNRATGNDLQENQVLVVTQTNHGPLAIGIQAVVGQVQVVLKPLGTFFPKSPGVAGAAILGDGRVALVLDIDNLRGTSKKLSA